jgi:N-acyl-L-homoserine lactone synthetase
MIHLIKGPRAHLESPVLRNMFAARKRVFVDLLNWKIPVIAGTYEVDQFDTREATYIVVSDAAGNHRASVRLLPTVSPHILDTLFVSLCDGPVPRGPTIFEITRFCLDRGLAAPARRAARDALVSAIARFGVCAGITRYTGVAASDWIAQIIKFGWRVEPLGPLRTIEGSALGAIAIEIGAETPGLLERAGIVGALNFVVEVADVA